MSYLPGAYNSPNYEPSRGCGAIITVLPRGLVARRHDAAVAIGLALLLVGVLGKRLLEVGRRVRAWQNTFEAGAWALPRRGARRRSCAPNRGREVRDATGAVVGIW